MTQETNKSKERDSRTQVKRSRRSAARLGPLYVDPKYLEAGYHYSFVTASIPGVFEYYERLGYVTVKKDVKAGDQTVATSSQHGSAVTVQSKDSQVLVLMRITNELFEELEQEQQEEVRALQESIYNPPGIDKNNLTGEIKITRN